LDFHFVSFPGVALTLLLAIAATLGLRSGSPKVVRVSAVVGVAAILPLIGIGLWPSLLSIGALFALPASAMLLGAVLKPTWMRGVKTRGYVLACVYLSPAILLLLVLGRPPDSIVEIPTGFRGWVVLEYDRSDCPEHPLADGAIFYRAPISGRVCTRNSSRLASVATVRETGRPGEAISMARLSDDPFADDNVMIRRYVSGMSEGGSSGTRKRWHLFCVGECRSHAVSGIRHAD